MTTERLQEAELKYMFVVGEKSSLFKVVNNLASLNAMDIAFDKHLQYEELKAFLENHFSGLDFLLIYEGVHGWDDLQPQQAIFQYVINEELSEGFKYGLNLYLKSDEILMIEQLAAKVSTDFDCATICDASRLILKERNVWLSEIDYAASVGKCQHMRHRRRKHSKSLKP